MWWTSNVQGVGGGVAATIFVYTCIQLYERVTFVDITNILAKYNDKGQPPRKILIQFNPFPLPPFSKPVVKYLSSYLPVGIQYRRDFSTITLYACIVHPMLASSST